jgi:hypothetical protein
MGKLERKPGGPDNWIERQGGLPNYIERIAVHLHAKGNAHFPGHCDCGECVRRRCVPR